jgi:HlyD family secretion protein
MAESPYLNQLKDDLLKEDQSKADKLKDDFDQELETVKGSKAKGLIPKLLVGLLVIGLVSGAAYWYFAIASPNQQSSSRRGKSGVVKLSNLNITVTANGTVQPEKLINASPKTSGRLKRLIVQEGDRVREGQILAYMDDSNLRGQLKQAQGQLESAEANLQKLKAGNRPQDIIQAQASANSQASLRQAESNLLQNQALYNSGAI